MKRTDFRLPPFRRFHADCTASLSVEAVLILPLLLWAFLATFTFFDIYRHKNLSLKANYAVSDLLSRETEPVDVAYIQGLKDVFAHLTQGDDPSWLRVSVLHCVERCGDADRVLELDWSSASDGVASVTDAQIMTKYEPVIPVIASGEQLIMVETSTRYLPAFSASLTQIDARDLGDIVMTRPRFAPQLLWSNG